MIPRFLLDTHIVVRWLAEPKKLSSEQARVLRDAVQRQEPLGVSAITLLEIAALFGEGTSQSSVSARKILEEMESSPAFRILPLTIDVAREIAALGRSLKVPADRAIVATARVNQLRLLTSDQRIIDSGLVSVVD